MKTAFILKHVSLMWIKGIKCATWMHPALCFIQRLPRHVFHLGHRVKCEKRRTTAPSLGEPEYYNWNKSASSWTSSESGMWQSYNFGQLLFVGVSMQVNGGGACEGLLDSARLQTSCGAPQVRPVLADWHEPCWIFVSMGNGAVSLRRRPWGHPSVSWWGGVYGMCHL